MAEWTVTGPDGKDFDVTAETAEDAWELANDYFKEQAQAEFAHLPLGDKILTSFDDAARITADSLSFGGADRFASWASGTDLDKERGKTLLSRMRMPGLAELGYDVAGAAATAPFIPSAVRSAGGAIKNPIARNVAKTGLAAGEGAAVSAAEGVVRDEDPVDWAKSGAVAGVLGKTLGDVAGWGIRKYKGGGVQPEPVTGGARSKAGKARENALNTVQDITDKAGIRTEGAKRQYYDTAVSEEIGDLLSNDAKVQALPPEVVEQLRQVRKGSLPVRGARSLNRFIHSPMGQSMTVGAGLGGFFLHPAISAAALGTFPAGILGQIGTNAATKRGMRNIQRDIAKIPPPTQPVAGEQTQEDVYKILRSLGL